MDDRGFETINIVPLVDVMLVLLTIILMTTTFVAVGSLPVQLPEASNTNAETVDSVILEIDGSGNVYFNHLPMSLEQIVEPLEAMDRSSPILIRADRAVQLQKFVDVMDLIKGLGYTKVSLQTDTNV